MWSLQIMWSSLSLPTPRMRKANNSCMVSAAHPLVTRRSYRLFRFSSFPYVTKGVIYIVRPPLHGDIREGAFMPEVKFGVSSSETAMSSLKVGHANSSVVGCKNRHKCLYSVPATEQQKRQCARCGSC